MFSIKRLISLGLTLLMLSTMLVFSAGVASAHTASPKTTGCYSTSCDGKSPVSMNCDSTAQTIYSAQSGDLGGGLKATASLRYSTTCGAAWAKVTFNKAMPSGHNGDANIVRNSTVYDCATAGGNGEVLPGQTSCYTSMVGDLGTTSYAAAFYWSSSTLWKQVATTTSY
jgi:hypothetical protein